jgi:hypothetical protein
LLYKINQILNTYGFCPILAPEERVKVRKSRTRCQSVSSKELHCRDKATEDRKHTRLR